MAEEVELPQFSRHHETEITEVFTWRRDGRIRWSIGSRWWSWFGLDGRLSSWRGSLSRAPARSERGWSRRTWIRARVQTVRVD